MNIGPREIFDVTGNNEQIRRGKSIEQEVALLMAKYKVLRQDFNHLYDLLVEAGVVPEDRA